MRGIATICAVIAMSTTSANGYSLSANSNLEIIKISLIDLAPTDGQLPNYSFAQTYSYPFAAESRIFLESRTADGSAWGGQLVASNVGLFGGVTFGDTKGNSGSVFDFGTAVYVQVNAPKLRSSAAAVTSPYFTTGTSLKLSAFSALALTITASAQIDATQSTSSNRIATASANIGYHDVGGAWQAHSTSACLFDPGFWGDASGCIVPRVRSTEEYMFTISNPTEYEYAFNLQTWSQASVQAMSTPVPEPSTATLLLVGLFLFLAFIKWANRRRTNTDA